MSITEASISPFPSGNGRFQDWYWPAADVQSAVAASSLNAGARLQTVGGVSVWSETASIAVTPALLGGVSVQQLAVTAVGAKLQNNNIFTCKPILQRGGLALPPGYNDLAAYRYQVVMAFDVAPVVQADHGFELVCATNDLFPRIVADAVGGIGWVLGPAAMTLIIRGGLGLQTFPITTPGFDATKLHAYGLRITSATTTQEATLQAFVDGRMFQTFAWGAGTILPSLQAAYRQMACIFVGGVNPSNLYVQSLNMASGVTQPALE